jgi:ParB family chromosome partitioning protein
LADHLAKGGSIETVQKVIGSESYQHFDSDERFQKVLAVFKPQPLRSRSENLYAPGGKSLAKVTQNDDRVQVTVDRRKSPEFASFLISKLQVLFKEFEAELSNTKPKHRQSKVSTEPGEAGSPSAA